MSAATSLIIGSSEAGPDRRRGSTIAISCALWRGPRAKTSGEGATSLAIAVANPQGATKPRRSDQVGGGEKDVAGRLDEYRQSIDNIDAALVFLLAERFKVTQAVGRYKAETGLPPADPGREGQQIARLRDLAQTAQLDPDFSEKFLRFIIDEVIRHHERVREA
jgi:chorismate mutase